MEHLLGQGWRIFPAGGATGTAYFAQHQEQRLFLKRNSSPFLAVLSAEGIVPKLVWTKRLENGDVITAQQWLNGAVLKTSDMTNERVAKMLKKIHCSKPLLNMLKRLGKTPLQPEMLLHLVNEQLDHDFHNDPLINKALSFLKNEVEQVISEDKAVCHCDVNHNNWLLTENNQLFLIDWDGAMIADPAIDLGLLLYSYIPEEEWESWLTRYGVSYTEHLMLRMKWYVLAQTLIAIQWHKNQARLLEMEELIAFLSKKIKL